MVHVFQKAKQMLAIVSMGLLNRNSFKFLMLFISSYIQIELFSGLWLTCISFVLYFFYISMTHRYMFMKGGESKVAINVRFLYLNQLKCSISFDQIDSSCMIM